MKLIRMTFFTLAASCAMFAECIPGGLAVVVNKANPTESLSPAQLRRIILAEIRTWPDHKPVSLVSRDAASDAGKCMLSEVVRMNDAEYHRYLLSVEFRGGEAVTVRNADSGLNAAKLVASAPGAIAVVEASALPAIASTVKAVKISGKLPGESGYPF